ncbi:MAG: RagB/SusD family nutrient uptake outer membrane protein [Proteiniphilum sp.]|nr:RagB/SusD family nutrient uptake outer membrane protein [Proteiniphilum sp.]MDD3908666.1 RagB/SusD family nutrient uptake outer membrane protein [Proteiniphilum sp.]
MRSKITTILLSGCLLFGASSCVDIERFEDGRISFEEIFQNDKKTAAYLNRCYAYIRPYGTEYPGATLLAAFTDESYDTNDVLHGSASKWFTGQLTPYYNPIENGYVTWNHYWTAINYCNVFLSNIDDAVISSTIDRKSWKAQAYALRAFYYLQLIKRQGGVPIILEPSSKEFDYSKLKKNSFAECAKQIISDCNEALKASDKELTWRPGNVENDKGRFSKAVIHAIRSQAALYAASPKWNDGTITWQDAATITKESLNACTSHGYSLFRSYPGAQFGHSAYDVYFYTPMEVTGGTDRETIYQTGGRLQIFKYHGLPVVNGMEKAGISPSQELIDSYETIDGVRPILGYSDDDHLHPIINPEATLYDESKPYENRDPRLKASIYYNGSRFNLNNPNSFVWTYPGGNCELKSNSSMHTRTGYYLRKYSHFDSNKNANKDGYFKLFRLAELYLNAAEAINEASTSGTAPAEAINLVNQVRSRVNMKAIPQGISKDEFRERVRNERRVELAFEEHRFFDVRRWNILDKTDRVVTGMSCEMVNQKPVYTRFVVDNERVANNERHLVFPIPGDEVIRLKNLTGIDFQNPGWN